MVWGDSSMIVVFFFSGRVDWWWIFRKIFLAFMVSTKDSASCPGQLATSQDITGSSESGPLIWYNEDEWRDDWELPGLELFPHNLQWAAEHHLQRLEFQRDSSISRMARDEKEVKIMVWGCISCKWTIWPPETSFSYLGCFVFILHKMAHFQSDCEAVVRWYFAVFHLNPVLQKLEFQYSIVWFFRTPAW